MVCILHGYYDVHPKMRFSLSPPPPKYTFIQDVTESTNTQDPTFAADKRVLLRNESNRNNNNNMNLTAKGQQNDNDIYVDHEGNEEEISDYIQWLHAMKLVARLPGGIPSEFRRKLWLSLADKYLKSKNINWAVEEEKCFCDKWREDDEELGVQIVKDLHRTGSTLCTGPTGDINQAKLKRILLGYARYNPEVGYCQGFNMLGALILQVMDKQESESIRVMIYLVEGILPTGYFCGSMGGLQADMAVFRELMQTKLPRLAKHLQKLQGPNENAYEPPLTNVFTMQWFLTMFCTCLPMNCVLRVWDLILIEGSDILLRTALVLWSLLEERVLMCYSADDFYGKMGSFSSKLLNGHLIDPNGLIEKIVQLGPITDIQTLREKHLYNITPLKHKPGIQLYYDGEEPDIDEDSQLAVATVWGLPWGRRSSTTPATNTNKQLGENKDRLALDISLLKKQYDRLRERQKQAHIILTTACSSAYQNTTPSLPNTPIPVNHLLLGCSAIVTNKGRRVGPPPGTIPPARKPSLPAVLPIRHTSISRNRLARGETIHDYGTSSNNKQLSRGSLTWKEIKAERAALQSSGSVDNFQSQKIRTRGSGKSDSSSYSEESEEDEVDSTTDTSLCDEDESESSKDAAKNKNNLHYSKVQSRKKLKSIVATSQKTISFKSDSNTQGNKRPKSWASSDIPFVLMTTDSPIHSADENIDDNDPKQYNLEKASENDANEHFQENKYDTDDRTISEKSIYGYSKMDQLSPIYDENTINNMIRPPVLGHSTDSENNETKSFDVSEEGVINEYFERVNIGERPVKLELSYSLPYEKSSQDTYIDKENDNCKSSCNFVEKELNPIDDYTADKILLNGRNAQEKDKFNLHKDYSKLSTKEYTPEVCTELTPKMDDICKSNYSSTRITSVTTTPNGLVIKQTAKDKRRDPRRLTRSYTIYAEDEQQYQKNNHISTIDKDPINIEKFRPKSDSLSFDENKRFELFNNEPSLSTYVLQGDNNKTNQERDMQQVAHKLSSIEDYRSPEEHTKLSTSPNKEDINFKQVSYTNKDDQFRKREKKSDNEDAGKEDDVREECLKANTENCKNTNSTTNNPVIRLKKIPSTAELEDRFNALERHNVIPQRSYSESKKEPPDGIAKVEIISEYLNSNTHSHSQTPSTKVQKESEEKKEVPNTRKKTPPSTEELERRFQTLEKKLSGNNTNEKPEDSVPNRNENSVSNTDSPKVKEEHVSNGTSIKQIKSTSPREFDLKKAFEDKCKLINKNIVLDTEELLEESIKNNVKDKSESMTEKRRNVEEKSGKQNGSLEKSVKDEEKSPALKRRSSEPPTTEELERRYESLKRRMSSRVIEETEILEKETETPLLKSAITKKQAELSPTPIKNAKQFENKVLKNTSTADSSEKLSDPAISKAVPQKVTVETNRVKKDYSKEYPSPKKFAIPKAPTPPQYMKIDNANNYDLLQIQHNALIEELQSKIKTPENGENIKPSSINQKRTTTAQRSLYRTNEASEAHAVIAFYTSEKCEPWTVQSQNMVRRFSDLPSRADLENRLQFLEEQLSKKFHKQYIAGDSEVSLRNKRLEEIPATYQSQRCAAHVNLEMRVQALEKQLSENSLKLLEAMGATAVAKADLSGDNLIVPRRLSTDTIDITGKELVKYTHVGELNELGAHHPINISINIKMSLQKSEHEDKLTDNNTQTLPTSQDLEKRLEQQVKTSAILTNECTESHQPEEREGKEDSQIEDSNEEVEVLVHPQHINDTDSENVGKNKDHKSIKQVEVRSNAEMIDELDKESNLYSSTQQNRMNTEECLKTGPEPNEMDKKEDLIMAQINDEDVTTLENKSEPNSEEKNNGNGTKLNEKIAIEAENLETPDSNKKTLVLLLDNQPKAVKVRRLTRANTEELEGLFQALEKQLSERNLIKAKDGTLKHATDFNQTQSSNNNENKCQAEAIAKLSQEITEFTKSAEEERNIEKKVKPIEDEPYDWGSDPIKHHLKRKTVYLPSTKELEARFRSLERQIKLLEDVEKIDVEQRLKEIERKIQLQYSLSHEKDINRFLELCEDKNLPDEVNNCVAQTKSSLTSPCHKLSQDKNTQTPTRTVGFEQNNYDDIPSTDNLEYRFRALELHDSKKLNQMTTNKLQNSESGKKQPIHPLEMLLEPGSDDNVIPTTGELEHRLRILEEKKKPISPTPSRSKSQSPIGKHQKNFSTYHSDETHSPPTTEELEARLKALEQKHTFDFKMQKNFREFNQKLKDITLSPSTSFEEPKRDPKSREQSPKHSIKDQYSTVLSKSYQTTGSRSTSPKVIRFKDDEDSDIKYTPIGKERMVSTSTNNVLQTITENSKTLHRILKKTLTDGNATTASLESLNSIERMNRLMKETSPLRRSGTHTGVPLRTADNINDRLTSIQNTIKSIDTLCEEKPYCKEKCQRYIDSLFHDSVYMAHKKSSLEELTTFGDRSRSVSKGRQPSIHVSDLSLTGSATSIALNAAYIPQYRSTRDLRRDYSPRQRYSTEREECGSRVRRNYTLPIYFKDNFNVLNNQSNSLIKFHHQVDRQLNTNNIDVHNEGRLSKISPLLSPHEGTEITTQRTISKDNITTTTTTTTSTTTEQLLRSQSRLHTMDTAIPFLPRPISSNSSLNQEMNNTRFNTPLVYTPTKLEIRHTTVTSTFYDRLLTEKHLEKTKIKPTTSKSPLTSPSVSNQNNAIDAIDVFKSTPNYNQSYTISSPTQIVEPIKTTSNTIHLSTTDFHKSNTLHSSSPFRVNLSNF